MREKNFVFRGILYLHSETGTEGGYWALQDERFITENTTHFVCKKCHRYWNKEKDPDGPEVIADISHSKRWCAPGTHEFELTSKESWSREGLHFLKDGDHLTIYSKENPSEAVWEGTIQLRQFPLFTEHALGLWIHADQVGVARETWSKWFAKENPAQLVTLERS